MIKDGDRNVSADGDMRDNIIITGDENRVEYHVHTGGTSSNEQIRATAVISEIAAMTFVDLMRLLGVRSDELVFEYNVDRYDEFVDIATEHADDLKNQIARYSSMLDDDQFSGINRIERLVMWLLSRMRDQPHEPLVNPTFFKRIRSLSDDVHEFSRHAGHAQYIADSALVASIIESKGAELAPTAKSDLGQYWLMRMGLQTAALQARESDADRLYGIWFDSTYELAFIYFRIDFYLLPLMLGSIGAR